MIGFIQGQILLKTEKGCVLLTQGGVGYNLVLPLRLLHCLPGQGEQAAYYVFTLVREDVLELYAFASWEERKAFEVLLGVSKLGPKTALAILSHFDLHALRATVARQDGHALAGVPGIGKKSAQRILLELQDKLQVLPVAPHADAGLESSLQRGDILAGLTNLGYAEAEVAVFIDEIMREEPDLGVGEVIRVVLKRMAAKRA
ncbi:MAG TPA: Holliday junction branch migration protein RuvA [Desulfonatronum sp.]|nr:Holliday junction branch migration protein RuvA [Desulfonatronum sp.]